MKLKTYSKIGLFICLSIAVVFAENCSNSKSDCVNIPSSEVFALSQKCSKDKELSKNDLTLLLLSSIGPTLEWTKLSSPTFPGRSELYLAELNNTVYMVGGYYTSDVWASSDGNSWTLKTSSTGFGTTYFPQMISFGGRLWVFNLEDFYTSKGGVWSSTNGVSWTKTASPFTGAGREDYCLVASPSAMYLIGGWSGSYNNDVWKSTDGISWSRAGTGNFSPRMRHKCVYYNNTFFLMGGYANNEFYYNEVWTSTDAINWTKKNGKKDSYTSSPNLFVYNGLYEISSSSVSSKIYKTTDGESWSSINTTGMQNPYQSSGGVYTYTSSIVPVILGSKLIAVTVTETSTSTNSTPTYSHSAHSLDLNTLPK